MTGRGGADLWQQLLQLAANLRILHLRRQVGEPLLSGQVQLAILGLRLQSDRENRANGFGLGVRTQDDDVQSPHDRQRLARMPLNPGTPTAARNTPGGSPVVQKTSSCRGPPKAT